MKKLIQILLVCVGVLQLGYAQGYKTHKVQKGETVESIAQAYQISEASIYRLNPDSKGKKLSSSAVLVIPTEETVPTSEEGSSVTFKQYRVKSKETLYSLAKTNDISIEEIKKYNPYLNKEELGEDDLIKIPIFREKKKVINFNESLSESSFSNVIHIVLPKETKYGISKKYGLSVEQLDELNPGVLDLKAGQLLKIVNKNKKAVESQPEPEIEARFQKYEVQPKETFYSLTRRFHVPKDSLLSWNPQLEKDGLQAGMRINIPKETNKVTPFNSAKKIDFKKLITNRERKKIAVMLPFSLQNFGESTDKEEQLKSDKVLRIALDFYSGVQEAIDKAEQLGIYVDAKIYDTQRSKSKVTDIISKNDFSTTQLVIGPLLTANVEEASRLLNNKNVPVLSPLTSGDLKGENNLIQTRPSDIVMEQAMISYLDSLKQGKNILILADKKHQFIKDKLSYTIPEARVITQRKADYLQQSDLTNLLDKDRENWIVLEADDVALVTNSTSYLNALSSRYSIRLFTSNKSDTFENEVPNQYLTNLKFTYASISKEYQKEPLHEFMKIYKENYGVTPNKYAVRGYDITLDAILRLAAGDNFYEGLGIKGTSEYVENKFTYHKKMIGGFYNDAVYLMQYQENLELKVLND
ncbi:LysM peptidoglycan-binding domain-containing protein [Mesonia ostreae]|uniref:LysM peptidoglycan-binding domain-containing protein n=1 Tax=Mesonia ostreae TaxID=861110 RepID=A0ABU2KGR8_9FLAO|nr:LysM peptidoglycan-binding domain-containing protein [Mesonia ostreae]MDT0293908.1 LysM peptidoglycan-binding domain-containing protein [Mesonia ostreae]